MALWLLICCYMSCYFTILCNFETSIWYYKVFHNVRVMVMHHVHVIQFLTEGPDVTELNYTRFKQPNGCFSFWWTLLGS